MQWGCTGVSAALRALRCMAPSFNRVPKAQILPSRMDSSFHAPALRLPIEHSALSVVSRILMCIMRSVSHLTPLPYPSCGQKFCLIFTSFIMPIPGHYNSSILPIVDFLDKHLLKVILLIETSP